MAVSFVQIFHRAACGKVETLTSSFLEGSVPDKNDKAGRPQGACFGIEQATGQPITTNSLGWIMSWSALPGP